MFDLITSLSQNKDYDNKNTRVSIYACLVNFLLFIEYLVIIRLYFRI